MKKFMTTSLAALMAVSALSTTMSTTAEARRGVGRGIAIGAGVILGAAALSAASRAEARDYRGYRSRCNRWYYRCNRGSDWACEKFDRYCD